MDYYRIKGRKFLRVTTFIQDMGLSDFSDIPARDRQFYMDRGKGFHRMSQDVEEDRSHLFDYDNRVEVYRPAHEKFLRDTSFIALYIERRVHATWKEFGLLEREDDEYAGLAGTFDRFGTIQDRLALLDYKLTALPPAVRPELPTPTAIQTALYLLMLCVREPRYRWGDVKRWGVAFRKDGTYSMSRAYPVTDRIFIIDAIRKYRNEETAHV